MAKIPTDTWTLQLCLERGWLADLAERRLGRGRISRDYLGFADIIAITREAEPIAIQHTSNSGGNMSARRKKVLASLQAADWARRGGRVLLIAWNANGKCREEDLTAELRG